MTAKPKGGDTRIAAAKCKYFGAKEIEIWKWVQPNGVVSKY